MEKVIRIAHGSGGVETSQLLEALIFSKLEERLKKVEGGLGSTFQTTLRPYPSATDVIWL
jgi:hydrogenase expression/formation protein HypE